MADTKEGTSNGGGGASQSKLVLAKPRLASIGNAFGSSSTSILNSQTAPNLQPAQFNLENNPFGKLRSSDEDNEDSVPSSSSDPKSKEKEEAPKFVPLRFGNVTTPRLSIPATNQAGSSSGFVFGQNISERVVVEKSMNNGEASSTENNVTNGSGLLFSAAAASVKDNSQEAGCSGAGIAGAEGLAAAAAEYERSHARPPPPTTNCTLTGEEDEINILQISCRLFAWEAGSWQERGRGVLRLNDPVKRVAGCAGGAGPRLVVRVAGSLRVLLNTKLWPEMVVERASGKSLRVTAADAEHQVKLFLIMGLPKDIYDLHNALDTRIMNIKRRSLRLEPSNETSGLQSSSKTCDLENGDEDFTNNIDSHDKNCLIETNDRDIDEIEKNDCSADDRLENIETAALANESTENKNNDKKELKELKRKESMSEEVSPKKQCPEKVDGV